MAEDVKVEKEILLKKRYTGHMIFIGELYKQSITKASTMVYCLEELLQSQEEEELVCMCKLFQTIGSMVEQYYVKKAADTEKKPKKKTYLEVKQGLFLNKNDFFSHSVSYFSLFFFYTLDNPTILCENQGAGRATPFQSR